MQQHEHDNARLIALGLKQFSPRVYSTMEDRVWRAIYSTLATLLFFVVFVGSYYAGQQGWWWMALIFLPVVFITIFSFLIPD